jgi:hypothetical protein
MNDLRPKGAGKDRGANDSLAITVTKAIHDGEIDVLKRLLAEHHDLATGRIVDAHGTMRTLLHIVADWPGHFPNGATSVATIAAAGGDPNVPVTFPDPKKPGETPLHWAASSDDVAVLDALLDVGAEIEAPGACIAGGTPLDDAVAFGQWRAAHRLVERGARTAVWHASALGLMDRVEGYFTGPKIPALYPWGRSSVAPPDELTVAFWCACHGGQRQSAEYLLNRGAQVNWISSWDHLTPLDAAQRARAGELVQWLRSRDAKSAKELGSAGVSPASSG